MTVIGGHCLSINEFLNYPLAIIKYDKHGAVDKFTPRVEIRKITWYRDNAISIPHEDYTQAEEPFSQITYTTYLPTLKCTHSEMSS